MKLLLTILISGAATFVLVHAIEGTFGPRPYEPSPTAAVMRTFYLECISNRSADVCITALRDTFPVWSYGEADLGYAVHGEVAP